MSDYVYLVMVTQENNNKFYEMKQNGSMIDLVSGRVGGRRINQPSKPMSSWDKIYKSKIKKGYTDQTTHHAVKSNSTPKSGMVDITHKSRIVTEIFERLVSAAGQSVQTNYTISAMGVTQAMIDDAQAELNILVDYSKQNDWTRFNDTLLQLFRIIPRKMQRVQDNLLSVSEATTKLSNLLIATEQDILDSMSGMVVVNQVIDDSALAQDTVFDRLGIVVQDCTKREIEMIKRRMNTTRNDRDNNAVSRFSNAVRITNQKTTDQFNTYVDKAKHQDTELYWHGSRTQNWTSIVSGGLTVRPTGVVITGKMFGNGTYFADSAQKSIGYSSLRGSYWSGGSQNYGYLAMYDVHTGNPWNIQRHQSSHGQLDFNKVSKKGYDCVYARGGADLRNDEIIVYHDNQSNIQYLVELS